ncbi:MAG: acetylornithine deacetylase [Desulfotomaculum sp. BICA1-6]|nr:MAG: acetylornithine deacetylase [Desulfotomaculum sp. BICA1-6]
MVKPERKVLKQWLAEHADEAAGFLSRLIQTASTAGREKEAQELMAEKFRHLGMAVDTWVQGGDDLLNHPHFCSPRTDFTDSPNVVGTLQGTGGGRSLIINGHIDVVPPGEDAAWERSPWSGYVGDGRVYGRGATDMKGGTLSALLAVEALHSLGVKLKGDIILASVVEEESGGSGTLASILRGYKADGAFIPEPSEMVIYPQQQGSMWFRMAVKGRVAHGGTRYLGVSAIENAILVINQVRELEQERNARLADEPLYHGVPIPVPINIGKIAGGSWPSSVPDLVTLEGRMGVAPGENMADARRELEQSMSLLGAKDEWFREHPVQLEWFGARWLPGGIGLDHPLMNALTDAYRLVKNAKPEIKASPWGTDGGLLTQVGGVPTVVFGPGVTAAAHYPNEYIEMKNVLDAAEIFALAIMEWCGVE